jgi:hypothetical protein
MSFGSAAASASIESAKTSILDGLNSSALRPVIARSFPFEEIVEVPESNQRFGKIVVTL